MLSSCYSATLICNMHQRKMKRKNSGCNLLCLFLVVHKEVFWTKKKKPTHKTSSAHTSPTVSLIHANILQFTPVLLNSYLALRNKIAQHPKHQKSGNTGTSQCVRCKRNTQLQQLSCKQCHYFAHMAFLKPKIQQYWQRGEKKPTPHHPKSTFHFAAYLLLNRPQRIPSFENRKINTHTPLMHSG